MRRYQLQNRSQPRREEAARELPIDPRDPAVLRAKQLQRSELPARQAR